MQPENTDEYVELGVISRLANGNVSRWVALVAAGAMVVPVVYWLGRLL